ncbi:MAG TPA: ABC transporter permease [Candidatus Corynebacterium gallistercoris]|uniref:ABC transporter permease n=1 Tax=Candidatus Corynebacterium gallistercoris TaxID=2838530 RepID=A0A9D1UQ73_9CORY|nr:ABC transporter permease [Candidatus Corynebacterium gallistercoris]
MSATETNRFAPGTFSPSPTVAPRGRILAAQAKIESLLFLRHGEQQLLSMVIPMGLLIGLSLVSGDTAERDINSIYPMALAIALMGAGFTGQAIAVAFDRRYGALKRIGASGVPTWALIGGKIAAVTCVVILQIIVLTVTALILGLDLAPVGIPVSLVVAVVGVASFTSLGLFLGGTLSSEMVLALGNTLWFVLMGAAVFATMAPAAPEWLVALPSVALMDAFHEASAFGQINWVAFGVLVVWGVCGTLAARQFFSFTMDSD